jgi:hypothetical protein
VVTACDGSVAGEQVGLLVLGVVENMSVWLR